MMNVCYLLSCVVALELQRMITKIGLFDSLACLLSSSW